MILYQVCELFNIKIPQPLQSVYTRWRLCHKTEDFNMKFHILVISRISINIILTTTGLEIN